MAKDKTEQVLAAIFSEPTGKEASTPERINIRMECLRLACAKKTELIQILELADQFEFFVLNGRQVQA